MQLHARLPASVRAVDSPPRVVRLSRDRDTAPALRGQTALLVGSGDTRPLPGGFALAFGSPGTAHPGLTALPSALAYLREGDVVRFNPLGGEIRVLYRRGSPHNVLFFTERCNSRCLMCSQPPRKVADDYHVDDILAALPLMEPDQTPELCISGGEPTLLGDRFLEVIARVRDHLPSTALHVLSNGRLFSYLHLARELAAVAHPDLMVGVPLYADTAARHDFVVQARGAFDQTVRGLLNLGRVGVRVELRVVIHRQSVGRLAALAGFIGRNLPFVSQVALMGLEMTGFTRSNLEALWVDPAGYQEELSAAVAALSEAGLRAMIYNHPLCVLPRELWPLARRSISDWKNIYLPVCEPCAARERCGGFFASATHRHSAHLCPVSAA